MNATLAVVWFVIALAHYGDDNPTAFYVSLAISQIWIAVDVLARRIAKGGES